MIKELFLIVTVILGINFCSLAQDYHNDSLFTGLGIYNTPVLIHPVRAGQTLYGLSRYYQVPVEAIQQENPQLIIEGLGVDKNINIPIVFSDLNASGQGSVLYYTVEQGETLFSIARRKFNISLADVIRLNELTSDQVSPHQVLKIGYLNNITNYSSRDGLSETVTDVTANTAESGDSSKIHKVPDAFEEIFLKQIENYTCTTDRGVAFWNKESAIRKGNYVLHKTAPVNSIVEITNPMFGIKVYGKVIGNLPPGAYTDDVKVVISPSMAKDLRARDSRFFSYVTYISK